METRRDDRSLGELFSDLTKEMGTLVRQEVQLAKTEMTDKAASYGKDAGFIGAGAAIAYAGFLAIILAIILLLGLAIPMWVSALIIGVVVAAIGAFLILNGYNRLKSTTPAPTQTIDTLKEDARWMKEQTT